MAEQIHENCYINRELSWLSFNERVLLEAADGSVPLLERLKFLMIYQTNLEEFYRVRIGILPSPKCSGSQGPSSSSSTASGRI